MQTIVQNRRSEHSARRAHAQTIVQNRRSAHSARRAHARILLSYEDQLYHQAE
jgi:hypothetical protein